MAQTSMGVKLDEDTRQRLKDLGKALDRTPHWLMKTSIMQFLQREEKALAEKQEDMRRWQAYKQTGTAIGHDEMLDWLDSLEKSL